MAQILQPAITDDPVDNAWSYSVTFSINDYELRLTERERAGMRASLDIVDTLQDDTLTEAIWSAGADCQASYTVCIGAASRALAEEDTAVGRSCRVNAGEGTAIGHNNSVSSSQGVAVGGSLVIPADRAGAVMIGNTGTAVRHSLVQFGTSLQALMLPNQTGTPSDNLVAGMMCYDTSDNKIKFYNGTEWRELDDSAA